MFSQDFKEFIELLNKNQIEYLVVGGMQLEFMDIQDILGI